MNIDQNIADWLWKIANALATIAVFVYTIFATRDKDNTSYIKAVEKTLSDALAEHASRLDKIETHIKSSPTPQQFYELQAKVGEIAAIQQALQSEIRATREGVTRIENYLLTNKI